MSTCFIHFIMYYWCAFLFQIFEWCHFVKMSGKLTNKVPFEVPSEGESWSCDSPPVSVAQQGTFVLWRDHLASMEQIYKDVVQEFQSLLAFYHMERETARGQRKLRKFPTFDQWKRVGSQSSKTQTSTTIESLTAKPTVVTYPEYLLETKQHSRTLTLTLTLTLTFIFLNSIQQRGLALFTTLLLPLKLSHDPP